MMPRSPMGEVLDTPAHLRPEMQGRIKNPIEYPSPFFDLAKMYLPPNIKELFKWCRYYYKTSPLIHPVIFKMAEYPVTDILFEVPKESGHVDKQVLELEQFLRDELGIKERLIEIGLDYFTYGNAFPTIYFPFKRFLICPVCEEANQFEDFDKFGPRGDFTFRNFNFVGTCPKCKSHGVVFKVDDRQIKKMDEIRIVRYNPENIDIEYNPVTGSVQIYYSVPNALKKKIMMGDFETLKETPWIFIQAVKEKKAVKLNKSNLYHFRRADISDGDEGWGMPLIIPAMREAFHLNVLKKAQEAVALEHLVPFRMLFPEDTNPVSAPHLTSNLGEFRSRIEAEIKKWKQDPNYIGIFPVRVGVNTFGGQGKLLMLTQEIRVLQETLINGMCVPQEFVFGGLSWSGSSISLRMLENHFLVYRRELIKFLNFVSQRIAGFLGITPLEIRMQDFKMADDIQRKELIRSLNAAKLVSDTTLLKEVAGIDNVAEVNQMAKDLITRYKVDELIARQQALYSTKTQEMSILTQAEAQAKALKVHQRAENEENPGSSSGRWEEIYNSLVAEEQAQNEYDQQGQIINVEMDPFAVAAKYTEQILSYPEDVRQRILEKMDEEMPELASLIRENLRYEKPKSSEPPTEDQGVKKIEPLPEKLPPRRSPEKAVI